MKGASIQVLGIEKGNGTTLTRPHNLTLLNNSPVSGRHEEKVVRMITLPNKKKIFIKGARKYEV